MAKEIDRDAAVGMLRSVADAVIANVDRLTDADLATGDGDHGIGMRRGFEAALESLDSKPPETVEDAFKQVGMAIMSKTGGAAGAVFGTVFRSGAKAFAGADTITAESFAAFLDEAQAAVARRGGVEEGQKTMLDAIAPAARAARACGEDDVGAVIEAASDAADKGVEATKDLLATTGKARSLGERSIGHPDPGAISISIILDAMKNTAKAS